VREINEEEKEEEEEKAMLGCEGLSMSKNRGV
jgi:hypothetical protein